MLAWLVSIISIVATPASAQTAEDGWAAPTTQPRPTSGEASFLSGRTLGSGEVLIAAALGWPGLWAHVELAPDSSVNIGVRFAVLYGSPMMGLVAGAGGEAAIPLRIHVWGEGDIDLSLRIAPVIAFGEGRLFGEQASDIRGPDLGVGSRLDLGARIAFRLVEHLTFFLGADASPGLAWVDTDRVHALGLFTGIVGVEALMSRDTMLFAEAQAGAGVAESGDRTVAYFPQQ